MISYTFGLFAFIFLSTSCISVVLKEDSLQETSRQTITCPEQCQLFEVDAIAQCARPLYAGCVVSQTCFTSLFFCDPASGGTVCGELSVNGFICTSPESEGSEGNAVIITPIPGSPAVDPTTGLAVGSAGTTTVTTAAPVTVTAAAAFAPTFPPTTTTTTTTTMAPPTMAPPTMAPPTMAPPTMAPPTMAPPTMAPPTMAPPTMAPPTMAPPTMAPPTMAPPTMAPPTMAPPTMAPPTMAPPTMAPPTMAPPMP